MDTNCTRRQVTDRRTGITAWTHFTPDGREFVLLSRTVDFLTDSDRWV